MRATLSSALSSGALIIGMIGIGAPAAAQPNPAYLAQSAPQAAPETVDRYGGWSQHAAAPSAYQDQRQGQYQGPPAAPAPVRYLAWTGKADMQPQTPATANAPGGSWTAMSSRWGVQPAPQAAQQPMAPQRPLAPQQAVRAQQSWTPQQAVATMAPPSASMWRPLYPQTAAQVQPQPVAAQPTSIYDAPAPQPAQPAAPRQVASTAYQGTAGGPRFYSLHREYGIQPDAIPLPPKFFGPTADLSAPPNDPIVQRTTTASGVVKTSVVPLPDDTSASQ